MKVLGIGFLSLVGAFVLSALAGDFSDYWSLAGGFAILFFVATAGKRRTFVGDTRLERTLERQQATRSRPPGGDTRGLRGDVDEDAVWLSSTGGRPICGEKVPSGSEYAKRARHVVFLLRGLEELGELLQGRRTQRSRQMQKRLSQLARDGRRHARTLHRAVHDADSRHMNNKEIREWVKRARGRLRAFGVDCSNPKALMVSLREIEEVMEEAGDQELWIDR